MALAFVVQTVTDGILHTRTQKNTIHLARDTMKITEMKVGAPCWFELSSTEPDKSKQFYRQLFGWQNTDMDMGPMGVYSFLNNTNGSIGACCGLHPDQKAMGMPSCWGVYFAVDSCDDTTAKATQLGATVLAQPFDVSEHGRMSVIADPTGAVFYLWQPKANGGGQFVMFEDHAVGWVELATRDSVRARDFYSQLLGWTYSDIPIPGATYSEISVGDTKYGGILPMSEHWGDVPPHWGIYVMVPDVDSCVNLAKQIGGSNPMPAFDAPGVGRIAMIADPTGANCYIIKLIDRPQA